MSIRIRYVPGPWLALVRAGHVLLLPENTSAANLDRLWETMGKDPSVESLLSAVLSEHGLTLTGMGPFGIVALTEDVHVILRGPLSLAAEGHELSTHVNGLGVTTWMERRLASQESIDVAIDDVVRRQHDDGEPWLPVLEGVVRFGRLHADLPAPDLGEFEPLTAGVAAVTGPVEMSAPVAAQVAMKEPAVGNDVGIYAGPAARPSEEELADLSNTMVSADEADDDNTIFSPSALAAARAAEETGGGHAERPEDEPAMGTGYGAPDAQMLIDAVPWLAAARASAPGVVPAGDHDGHTVMRGDIPTMAIPVPPEPATGQPTGPLVLGRTCAAGHANPPTASACAVCGAGLDSEPVEVVRPSLGRMVVSGGEVIDLDRSAIVGRQPSVPRSASGSMPRIVQVASPSSDISRSHVEIRLEGWHVLLVDLKATNGTLLVRAGNPPRRLGQGEKLMLLDGDIADLGDGVSLRFEGLL